VDASGQAAAFSSRHDYLTITAPGVEIASLSRTPGVAYAGDGTSQATAIASAVVALVWSKYPQLSGRQIVTRVLATLDRHSGTRDPAYGYGVVNAYRAVTAAVPADAANPVYDATEPFRTRAAALAAPADRNAPPPVAVTAGTGSFAVGTVSRWADSRVVIGAAVAVAGLVMLLALVVTALVHRRRRSVPSAAAPPPPELDESGLLWHEIS
jgi:subtilisin family serine protease